MYETGLNVKTCLNELIQGDKNISICPMLPWYWNCTGGCNRRNYYTISLWISQFQHQKGHQITGGCIQRISYCIDSHSTFNCKTIHRCKQMQSLHGNIDIYSSISMHFLIRLPQMLHNKPQTIIWKSFQYQGIKNYVCHKSYFSCWSLVWFGLLSLKLQLHLLPVCQISSVKIVHFNGTVILLSTIKSIYLIRAL